MAPRSVVAEIVTRRRRASSAAPNPISHPPTFGLDPYVANTSSIAARRNRRLSVSGIATSAGPSSPRIDNSHLAVPPSPGSGLRRKSSLVSLHGGQGASVGIIMSDGNLRGTVASAISAAQSGVKRDASRGRDLEAEGAGPDDEEITESDYTTDGTAVDEEEHHLDEVVDVSSPSAIS